MRFIKTQTSFKSGRLSPKLFNRVDVAQYNHGAAEMKGFRVIPEGGAEAIKGTRLLVDNDFAASPTTSDALGRSKQFSFSINGFPITCLVYNWLDGSDNKVTFVFKYYPYEWDNEDFWDFNFGSDFLEARLFDFAVIDNYVVTTHFSGKYKPQYFRFVFETGRLLDTRVLNPVNSVIQAYGEFQSDSLTYTNYNEPARTVDFTSTNPDVVLFIQSKDFFYIEDFVIDIDGDGLVASNFYRKTANITNGVRVTYWYDFSGKDVLALAGGTPTFTFNTWAANLYGENNYARTVTIHESRVVFGGCPEKPLSLVGSEVSNVFDFNRIKRPPSGTTKYTLTDSGDILTTDPYFYTIGADIDSEITAVRSASELFIGTDRREYIATGGDVILSPFSIQIKPYTANGVYPVSAELMNNLVVYVDQSRKKLFQFKYNGVNGSYTSDEISIIFNDVMENDTIKEIEWAAHVRVLYILTDAEKLYGITYDPSAEILAFYDTGLTGIENISYVAARDELVGDTFHRGDHLIYLKNGRYYTYENEYYEKGVNNSAVQAGTFEQNLYLFLDNVFMVEKLGINSYSVNGKSYTTTDQDNFFYPTDVDVSTANVVIYNLDQQTYLEIGNVFLLPQDSSNGFIRYLDANFVSNTSKILIGNMPTAQKILKTLPIEAGQQFGTAQMGIKNVDHLGVRFYKSYSYEISTNGVDWQEVVVADNNGNAATGRKETKISGNPNYDYQIWIRLTKPQPLTITGLNMRGLSNDG